MGIKSKIITAVIAGLFSFSVEAAEIRLSGDETQLIRLDRDAASVIVANPLYANVLVDTPRHLVVIPRQPGTTMFTVLDMQGDVIQQDRIIVGAKKKNYVTIRRACSNAGENADCKPVSQYYCTDGCYEVNGGVNIGDEQKMAGLPTTDSKKTETDSVPLIPLERE
ncbi:MAG: hypothetical protein CMH30_06575 [Micavibrio sp.]|nr:hypothetical protein [Micavibrio sp.]|tara:strand:+ start:1437 stop:1934 length:498 start_codon:yes stop_codon:yes gene_type:complete